MKPCAKPCGRNLTGGPIELAIFDNEGAISRSIWRDFNAAKEALPARTESFFGERIDWRAIGIDDRREAYVGERGDGTEVFAEVFEWSYSDDVEVQETADV